MEVEIWSDVMCPFCYIGKRKFEKALEQYSGNEPVNITWKSFQLNPDLKTDTSKNTTEYLAEVKGWALDYANGVTEQVTQMAKEVGLNYHLNKAVVANSFNAHRFIQFAKKHNKGNEAEEQLFNAYFTDGKNIDDFEILAQLAENIALSKTETIAMLNTEQFKKEVEFDLQVAREIGVTGVPFFVFNRKYAVSGAQDSSVFLQTLNKIASEN